MEPSDLPPLSSIPLVKPLLMFAAMITAMMDAPVDPGLTESFVKYAMTQGGLFLVVLVLGWSYRRDFIRLADQKTERIQVLTDMAGQAAASLTKTADALLQSTAVMATQAVSIQQMTAVLARLEGSMAGRRGVDHGPPS